MFQTTKQIIMGYYGYTIQLTLARQLLFATQQHKVSRCCSHTLAVTESKPARQAQVRKK
jgi:hypothetical protein